MDNDEESQSLLKKLRDYHMFLIQENNRIKIMRILVLLSPLIFGYVLLPVGVWYLVPNGFLDEGHVVIITEDEMIERLRNNKSLQMDTPIFTMYEVWNIFFFTQFVTLVMIGMQVDSYVHTVETQKSLIGDRIEVFPVLAKVPTDAGYIALGPELVQEHIITPKVYREYKGISGDNVDLLAILHKADIVAIDKYNYEMILKKTTSVMSGGTMHVDARSQNKMEER